MNAARANRVSEFGRSLNHSPALSMAVLGGGTAYQKFLGSKEHLAWLKIYPNVAKVIPIQNYKRSKN